MISFSMGPHWDFELETTSKPTSGLATISIQRSRRTGYLRPLEATKPTREIISHCLGDFKLTQNIFSNHFSINLIGNYNNEWY